jgi:hypothetical protein
MKKTLIGLVMLAALYTAIETGCGSMRHPKPPPKPPGAPAR